jgi:hypothetical protein
LTPVAHLSRRYLEVDTVRLRGIWAAVALLPALARPAQSQAPGTLVAGEQVRLELRGPSERLHGTVLELVPDTLVLADSARTGEIRVGLSRIRSLSVYRGPRDGRKEGVEIGLSVGFLAGLAVGIQTLPFSLAKCPALGHWGGSQPGKCSANLSGDIIWAGMAGFVGALVGFGLGELIGSGIHGGRWERLPVDPLIFRPVRPGAAVGVGLSVSF